MIEYPNSSVPNGFRSLKICCEQYFYGIVVTCTYDNPAINYLLPSELYTGLDILSVRRALP